MQWIDSATNSSIYPSPNEPVLALTEKRIFSIDTLFYYGQILRTQFNSTEKLMPDFQLNTVITEALISSPNRNIDIDKGVIEHVKLVGFESRNGRVYPPTVLKAAVALYEGAKVNIDHPAGNDPSQPRAYLHRFGVIRRARFVEGAGIFGDCHFNPMHPQAAQVCWDAQHNPSALGFSHNAILRLGKPTGGKETIEEIIEIRSVDLVADPATTTSLFESTQYEEQNMEPTSAVATSTASPKDQIKAAYKQMIMAAIDDESLDTKATLAKIREVMRAQEKLMGDVGLDPSEHDETDAPHPRAAETGQEQTQFDPSQLKIENEILLEQLAQYQAKEKLENQRAQVARSLQHAGLNPDDPRHVSDRFLKQLLETEQASDRNELIAERAELLGVQRPGISSPQYVPATASVSEQIDTREFARRLLD
jgi:hypothetical protein